MDGLENRVPGAAHFPAVIARRLIAAVLVLNLFVLSLVGLSLYRSYQQSTEVSRLTAENISRVLEEGLTRFIDKVDLTLLDVSEELDRQKAAGGVNPDEMKAFMARHDERMPEVLGLRVVGADGLLKYAANQVADPKASVAGMDAFEHWKQAEAQGFYISKPLLGPISGRPLVVMARRLNNPDGSFAGQVHVSVGLEQLARMFEMVQLGPKGSVTLTDGKGRALARNPNPNGPRSLVEKPIFMPVLSQLITEGKTAASYHARSVVDQVERAYFFRKLDGRDLYMLVGVADEDSLASWWRQVWVMTFLSSFFALITVLSGMIGFRGWLDRHRVTEELAAKEVSLTLFREALEKSNDAILIIDLEDGHIVDFNQTACEQLGRPADDMRGLSLVDVDPELSGRDAWSRLVEGSPALYDGTSVMFERLHQRPDGTCFPIEVSWRMVQVGGRRLGISIERDISERKKFESRIDELSQLNERVISESVLGLLAYRKDGSCILVNRAAARFLGGRMEDLLTQNFRSLPSWNETLLQMAEEVLETGQSHQVSRHFASTFGKSFWVDATFSRFTAYGEPHLLLAFNDVSEQKEAELALKAQAAELEKANADLLQSNADLERFAYVASHDLQTPLRTIVSYTQLLERRSRGKLDEDCQDFIIFIVEGAKRMSRLIIDLLEYARVTSQGKPLEAVSAERAAEFALANLQGAVDDSHAKVSFFGLPRVMADESQLVSLFQNLIGNAIKYRHPDRSPEITVRAELGPNNVWSFTVADNGIGIEKDYFSKVFEIFQRLNPSSHIEGTGVGLAVCQRIVRRFGGDIWLESEPGQGSVFHFTLKGCVETETAIPVA